MTRSAWVTVRLPGARTAPPTNTKIWFQTGAVKHGRKAAGAKQAMLQTKRWLPDRRVVVVADEPAPERQRGQKGRPPEGKRRPKLTPCSPIRKLYGHPSC
jgi:hypothetical protein